MIDSNQNITRKFDFNRKKIKLKIDFDSSLTCYSLDPKSIWNFYSTFVVNSNNGGKGDICPLSTPSNRNTCYKESVGMLEMS